MLFNSNLFLFVFLPFTLLLFFSFAKISQQAALGLLLIASLIFYGWSDYHFLLILIFSICLNFLIGQGISYADIGLKKWILVFGISFNLALLGYYKYTNFFIQNINVLFNLHLNLVSHIFPIGISFFTFTQIAFLVDSFYGELKYNFLPYALFVTYFPHLIAGPIIHHQEVMPQFSKRKTFKFKDRNILLGLMLFSIGLFKKTVLADSLAEIVNPVFDGNLPRIDTLSAWMGVLAYTFELYFDFSGYSDMALGISLFFNIKLPVNFYSPYKATNIIEFWRRWNMTLSRFLKYYLYIPLGGNQKGNYRKYVNLMITMLLGGLWHGADWMFVFWGLLHGLYLCINHAWGSLGYYFGIKRTNVLTKLLARIITFIAVMIAWIFFRAPNLASAQVILKSMFLSLHFSSVNNKASAYLVISMIIVWGLPNAYQFLQKYNLALMGESFNFGGNKSLLTWAPTTMFISMMAGILVLGIIFAQESTTFLYFKF